MKLFRICASLCLYLQRVCAGMPRLVDLGREISCATAHETQHFVRRRKMSPRSTSACLPAVAGARRAPSCQPTVDSHRISQATPIGGLQFISFTQARTLCVNHILHIGNNKRGVICWVQYLSVATVLNMCLNFFPQTICIYFIFGDVFVNQVFILLYVAIQTCINIYDYGQPLDLRCNNFVFGLVKGGPIPGIWYAFGQLTYCVFEFRNQRDALAQKHILRLRTQSLICPYT